MREGEGPRFTRERKGRISTRSWVLGRVVDGVDGACDGTVSQLGVTMARTRNAVKRQKVATVESALFNPDVVFLLAALLDARDLCQVSLTCKTLGGKQAAYSGLSHWSRIQRGGCSNAPLFGSGRA